MEISYEELVPLIVYSCFLSFIFFKGLEFVWDLIVYLFHKVISKLKNKKGGFKDE